MTTGPVTTGPVTTDAPRRRRHALRLRLTAGLLAVLALGSAAVGVAAVLGLHGFLVSEVDQQLASTGTRYAGSLSYDREPDGDGDEYGDTRRQAAGTLGARISGSDVNAAVVGDADEDHDDTGAVRLTSDDTDAIIAVPVDVGPTDLDLSIGDYRVIARSAPDGAVLLTGLPLAPVHDATRTLIVVEIAVFGIVLVLAGLGGAWWVRRSLRPLDRVADTATEVTSMPLERGEVALTARVPDDDPDSEVGRVAVALNAMLGHVERSLATRERSERRLRTFAADAGHELRTPVASVRGHAELALREADDLDPPARRSLERIAAESARMSEIVDELLLLARLDAGRRLEQEEVDLSRIVVDATDDARAVAPRHRWRLDLRPEPVTVTGDRLRLQQVVGNLLTNARTHTPDGTTVTTSLRERGDVVELAVTDDGPGIPEALREVVFDRFTRGEGGRSDAGAGAGLGLAIVAAVVEVHGGSVRVDSAPGRTAFTVTLPRTNR